MKNENGEEIPTIELGVELVGDAKKINQNFIWIFIFLAMFGIIQSILTWKIGKIEHHLSEKKCEMPLQQAPTISETNAIVG